MPLQALKLTNFRNYQKFSLTFSPNSNLIFGANGLGKTNLLEAIYFALFLKSYRTRRDQNLVQWGEKFLRVELEFHSQENVKKIAVFYDSQKSVKQANVDDVRQPLLRALGCVKGVLFSPEGIQLVTGSPSVRRRFLDLILAQSDRRYPYEIYQFNRILKQRNSLLWRLRDSQKNIEGQETLEVWDRQFLAAAVIISQKRQQLSQFINDRLTIIYQQITQNKDKLKMVYKPNNLSDFASHRHRDIILGFTEAGPHRDDPKFILNNRSIIGSGSRGELRAAILSLKVVELEYIQEKTGNRPLLLLDDVFSELDSRRRGYLERLISQYQTIVTAVSDDNWRGENRIDLAAEIKKVE